MFSAHLTTRAFESPFVVVSAALVYCRSASAGEILEIARSDSVLHTTYRTPGAPNTGKALHILYLSNDFTVDIPIAIVRIKRLARLAPNSPLANRIRSLTPANVLHPKPIPKTRPAQLVSSLDYYCHLTYQNC
jgi:hypothetical protein